MIIIVFLCLCLLCPPSSAKSCYSQQGNPLNSPYSVCDPNADYSACCALNQTDPDVCLSSGLCLSTHQGDSGTIWLNGCTDKSGNANACPTICRIGASVVSADSWNVMQCPTPEVWCCRSEKEYYSSVDCCNMSSRTQTISNAAQLIGTVLQSASTATGVSASATTTGSSASSGTLPNSTSGCASTECPTNHTVTVGAAVGATLGAGLIAALSVIVWISRGRSKVNQLNANSATAHNYKQDSYHGPQLQPVEAMSRETKPQELSA